MSRSCINHRSSLLDFIFLFINNIAFIREYWSNVVFFFLSSNKKYFILCLNRWKFLWKNISISNLNLYCILWIQLMNKQRLLFFAIIVKSWFYRSEYVIWFKTYNIMKKPSEFVSFRFYFNHWPCIFLNIINMATNFIFKIFHILFQIWNYIFLLQHFQKFFWLV